MLSATEGAEGHTPWGTGRWVACGASLRNSPWAGRPVQPEFQVTNPVAAHRLPGAGGGPVWVSCVWLCPLARLTTFPTELGAREGGRSPRRPRAR